MKTKSLFFITLFFAVSLYTFTSCNNVTNVTTSSLTNKDGEWSDWDAGFVEDYEEFIPSFDYLSTMKVEAENTKYSLCRVSEGGSGKVLDWTSDDTLVKFNIEAEEERVVELFLQLAVDFSENRSRKINDRLSLLVNGKPIVLNGEFSHDNLEEWWFNYILLSLGEIQLSSGKNIIELKLSDSVNLDYLQIDL